MRRRYGLLSHLPGFVLLESSDVSTGRYDIVSACPYESIRIDADDNIDDALRYIQKKIPRQPSTLDLPFQGGAIAYLSYDLGERLAGIFSRPQPGLEGLPLADFGLYDWAIICDHHLKKVSFFAANRQPETAAVMDMILTLWEKSTPQPQPFSLQSCFTPMISRDHYEASFEAIHEAITKGRSYQVNYTQPFIADYTGSTWGIYDSLCTKNPVPFSAYLNLKDSHIISCSPERYLLMEKGQLLTSPIKGTVKRSLDSKEDWYLKYQLEQCPKNRAENVMIVDLMRNDLGKIAMPGTVEVTALCKTQSFNGVHHLVSDIQAQCLPSLDALQAFLSCFPGGSITGAPKLEAMRIISEQEPYSRGVYCGSIACFSSHGRFDSNIAIRTITAKDGCLHLSAGGGIVIDSSCQEEYLECFTKVSAIINALEKQ